MKTIDFVYFGGEPLGAPVLEILIRYGLRPRVVVTNPDRKSGRGRLLTAPPTKILAEKENIPVLQPLNLTDETFLTHLQGAEAFVVVAFNTILPPWFLDIPSNGTLNVHPSLLPLYRGPSPVRSAILADDPAAVGVTVMLLDEKMDHGPILAQAAYTTTEWPPYGTKLEHILATKGGELLAKTLPAFIAGKISPQAQVHEMATYTQKFTKEMGEVLIDPTQLPRGSAARQLLLQIRAFDTWPGTFFFHQGKRIKITSAHIDNDQLVIDTIIPEGKSERNWKEYFM